MNFLEKERKETQMSKLVKSIFLMAFLPLVVGCSSGAKDTLGLRRTAPDEFKVISNPPLSLPPEFSLRPPSEGVDKAAVAAANEKEVKGILEKKSPAKAIAKAETPKQTKGEGAFLSSAGTGDADSQIKEILNKETSENKKEEKGFFSKLASFKDDKDAKAEVVNASGEKDRIAKNKEEGKPVTEGETPTATPAKKGLLQNIFDW
jgi:hypothetical protein